IKVYLDVVGNTLFEVLKFQEAVVIKPHNILVPMNKSTIVNHFESDVAFDGLIVSDGNIAHNGATRSPDKNTSLFSRLGNTPVADVDEQIRPVHRIKNC